MDRMPDSQCNVYESSTMVGAIVTEGCIRAGEEPWQDGLLRIAVMKR
jgi:hypothetical protein